MQPIGRETLENLIQRSTLALEKRVHEQTIPSVSVAVVTDQDILWSMALGYADLENRIPATPQTV